ncbi:DUF5667 domain-containing protein [Nonomuraea diastatica]|uniref:DUF5667 domain-containing protein n=1 Tax=Nonomuraea diastatica TaxID=1848329 RepID=A0A4R4WU09_9ACTN|nr:DUF5667 domain-containing protein [Nonomuraea diastatica]TDD21078.1 hypothetical protein E1294_16125 [Nonomuraea diastatica]
MGRARERRERVLEHLTDLPRLPLGGAPDPAFRDRLRAELVSGPISGPISGPVTGELLPERPALPRHAHRRPAHPRPLLSQLAAFGLSAAMMVASFATYQAVPGDSLYPLKRAAESALVGLSTNEAARGERELRSAKARAEEVASLLGSSNGGPLVGKTLKDMEESTRAGISRLRRAEPRSPKIKKFARHQKEVVGPMLRQLKRDQLAQAEGYLDYIEGLVAPG